MYLIPGKYLVRSAFRYVFPAVSKCHLLQVNPCFQEPHSTQGTSTVKKEGSSTNNLLCSSITSMHNITGAHISSTHNPANTFSIATIDIISKYISIAQPCQTHHQFTLHQSTMLPVHTLLIHNNTIHITSTHITRTYITRTYITNAQLCHYSLPIYNAAIHITSTHIKR